ncbi:hypothetical protein HK105_200185 [Polyrhizophydium stewartii]|uniref:Nudix hydrolase domain-containing protein n=1 Tax=Polyrhizophydium stewartii TaxID=2732419 RepID=A0ABR4NL13_9FUNG|nr:hypothetical protein HK105_006725 [Polyrhizophydium stewartii]
MNGAVQMAFPGGKAERGETDRQAAVRETREETGLLLDTPAFTWIGELDDRDIIVPNTGRHIMVLSCHVFVQLAPATPPTRLQTSEVAGTHWIPLSYLHMPRPSDWRPVPMRIAHYAIPPTMLVASPWQIRVRRSLADAITLLAGDCVFRGIAVPGDPPGSFPIWGMTLWLLSDLLAVADGVPVDSPAALVVGGFPKYTSPDVHWIVSVLTLGRYPSRLFFDDGKASSGLQMHNAVALGIFISMAWKTAAIAQVVRYTPRLIRWLRASL